MFQLCLSIPGVDPFAIAIPLGSQSLAKARTRYYKQGGRTSFHASPKGAFRAAGAALQVG